MNIQEAIKFIVDNYASLKEKSNEGVYSKPVMDAVWVAKSDLSEPYEVDMEWVGVTPDGRIAWAYASGCSCWDGDFSETHEATIKELKLNHNSVTPEQWEASIIKFAETQEVQELSN